MYYNPAPKPDVLFQGDILRNFPVTVLPSEIEVFRNDQNPPLRKERDLEDAFVQPELVVTLAHKTNVMVLSQTCDIEQREFAIIAPILQIAQVTNQDRKRAIIQGRVNYRFWLPFSPDVLDESFVELSMLNSVPKALLRVEDRILSLTDSYRHHLADTLHRLFCRPFFYISPEEFRSTGDGTP